MIQFPEKLQFLFQPARYKCAYGGRGSGKSWGFARALLVLAASKPMRVLCTREVQKSIQQSVHKLLSDQIQAMGLGEFYEVLETVIRGKNGSEFAFSGLASHTVQSIKSFEGVDVVWCEEAQVISKKSWEVLIPTIRKPGSEIWVTMNPELETDDSYQRFVASPPPGCKAVLMNHSDNPWFSGELEQERLHAKATMKPTDYRHIWEGACKPAVDGAFYADEIAAAAPRISAIPHDHALKTHVIWDLGFADSMALILAQRLGSEVRIVHYIEGNRRILADYVAELREIKTLDGSPVNWGTHFLPHDGFATRHQTGKPDATVLRELGLDVQQTPHVDFEQGIKRAREMFPRVFFNKQRAGRLVECLKRYRRAIHQTTGQATGPVHDEFSHGADAFRYLAMCEPNLTNDEGWSGPIDYPDLGLV